MNILKRIFLASLCIFFAMLTSGNAQDLLKTNDLSQIKTDQLSDAEVAKFYQQLQSSGLTIAQAEQIALSKGMPAEEIAKLKERLPQAMAAKSTGSNISTSGTSDRTLNDNDDPKEPAVRQNQVDPDLYGSELFNNASLTFQGGSQIATPMNYELGPGDELQISVYGVQEMNINPTISTEGMISVPNVGQLKIAGLTIEAATARIKNAMAARVYPTLRSGTSKLAVSLGGRIRSIHVTVIGAARPGNYTLSSLATTFNALYLAGGPAIYGSFRDIELIRNNKVDKKIDLYRFLVNGDQSDNITLKDNDVIRIPAYKKRVELRGQVKRQGIFELKEGENFNDLLEYASGFTDTAYRASVKLVQLTDRERSIKDISADQFGSYIPASGDVITVSALLNRFKNRVNISGAVYRPGFFELSQGMSLAQLINKADGIKEDAFTERAQLIRLKEDLTKEIISFNVRDIINGKQQIMLQKEDEIIISSIFDLKDEFKISIQGEVRAPGEYMYVDGVTLKDLIIIAGGFTDAAKPQKIELSRMLKKDTLTSIDERASEIIEIKDLQDLSGTSGNVQLKPFDVITVRRKPGYENLASVLVTGQLQYPGPYTISTRSERISDVLKRAGGFTPEAFIEGAYLKRYLSEKELALKKDRVSRLQEGIADTSAMLIQDVSRKYDQIPLDLEEILRSPGTTADLILKGGDELYVPKFDAQVRINGGVLMPTQIPYSGKLKMRDYLSSAGGVSQDAVKRKIYVLYANGKAANTKHFLFFKNYPTVKAGSEVVVPKKMPKATRSSGETIAFASVLASLAGVVIAIINVTK